MCCVIYLLKLKSLVKVYPCVKMERDPFKMVEADENCLFRRPDRCWNVEGMGNKYGRKEERMKGKEGIA